MAKRTKGRSGFLVTGLGLGVAAGVALGALVLAPNMPDSTESTQSAEAKPAEEPAAAESEDNAAQAATADAALAEAIPATVEGTLEERPVLVLTTHDANSEHTSAVRDLLGQASAIDAGHIRLTEQFFSPDRAEELRSIVAAALPAGAELSADALDPGTHAGEALGSALLLNPETAEAQATTEERATMLQALRDAGFIEYMDNTILPAQAVVLITGETADTFAAENVASFATALDGRGNGTVLAGPMAAAAEGGPIDRIRSNADAAAAVSTVDSINRAWGRGAAVLAVPEQIDGGSGAYGAAESADAALPSTE